MRLAQQCLISRNEVWNLHTKCFIVEAFASVSPYLESRKGIFFIDLHQATSVRSQPQMVSHSEKRFDATERWRSSLINAVWWWCA